MFRPSTRGLLAGTALSASALLALSGCSASNLLKTASDGGSSTPAPKPAFKGTLAFSFSKHPNQVRIGKHVTVSASNAQLQNVTVKGPGGSVPGSLNTASSRWKATTFLKQNSRYVVSGVAVGDNGVRKSFQRTFRTAKLTLNQQTYPSFLPASGDTVGIGMPVIIRFDVPVTNKARIQKAISVTSSPAQPGAFHWISDNELHWRPKHYWKAGTTVHVHANIGGVPAGHGIWGQLNRSSSFHVGRAQIIKVNLNSDELKVVRGGQVIKTIPVTAGQEPDFTTRSGTKVIMEKDPSVDMNSETIGINPHSSNGYNLKGVKWAMRLTNSGEFLHAAPWSVYAQGHENVSHGCTGMSTDLAHWLYDSSLIGDPVEYTGTSRYMTLDNGIGDWNEPFRQYAQGSAVHG